MSDSDQTQSAFAREHLKQLARLRQQIISEQQQDRDGRAWARRVLLRFASGGEPEASHISVEFARRALGLVSRRGVR